MNIEQIFEESASEQKANCVTYSDKLAPDQYVEQFLAGMNVNKDLQINEAKVQDPEEIEQFEDYLIDQPLEVKPKSSRKPRSQCSFHNFQKHLTLTMKYQISLDSLQVRAELKECVESIWQCFKTSKKTNKTLLSLLLAGFNDENPFKVAEYGFGPVLEGFEAEIIQESQQILSKYLIKQLKELQIEQVIEPRRIKHKEQFVLYFREFLKEVEKGALEKRIIKCVRLVKKLNLKAKQENAH